jgi:o-succinylbenzoate---CoA ligase
MTSDRPLITLAWLSDPDDTGSAAARARRAAELISLVRAALAGGPALTIIPNYPAARRLRLLDALGPQHPLESPEVAFVVPTSGTSGAPKGVLLSAAAVEQSARATHVALGGPGHWLLALPPTRVAGLLVLVRAALAGLEPELMDFADDDFTTERFAAATARLDASARRYTALVPTQLDRLLADETGRTALAGYDAILLGGAAAPAGLLATARDREIRVVSTYGMTETAGGCVYDGRPLPGVRVEVGPDRQIKIGGPTLASGYRLRPDLTAERFRDGWFHTSDYGELSADGRLRVLGRSDDVLITGGVNVSAAQAAALLQDHPLVGAAVAFGVPDPRWGERLVAAVVPREPDRPPKLDEVRDWVKERAEPAMAPRELVTMPALPMLPSGKVDVGALRAAYATRAGGPDES